MAQHDLYLEFLQKLKKDKTEEEIAEFLSGLMKFGSAQLMTALFYFLTVEDMEEVEKIKDEKLQEEEIKKRFQMRTGVTTLEFLQNLRDTVAKHYLFPELKPKNN